jgi:hypothetical protein|tara:strand:- start:432 stop:671 length:240 start_codon:yes stop_codon:yes gene_type:complete
MLNLKEQIKEGLVDMALGMTTSELAESLGLKIDALTIKDFGDTSGACEGKEILFTGYDIISHDELCEMWADDCYEIKFA